MLTLHTAGCKLKLNKSIHVSAEQRENVNVCGDLKDIVGKLPRRHNQCRRSNVLSYFNSLFIVTYCIITYRVCFFSYRGVLGLLVEKRSPPSLHLHSADPPTSLLTHVAFAFTFSPLTSYSTFHHDNICLATTGEEYCAQLFRSRNKGISK